MTEAENKIESEEKSAESKIAAFLRNTGFILEMEIAEALKKNGYKVAVNRFFYDYDENKKREIDIIATKKVGEIEIVLVVECKQSSVHDWIFVCSDREPSRWYAYMKELPNLPHDKPAHKTKVFDRLHVLNRKFPLAQNSIIRHKSGKKSDSDEIYECVMKLPKAVVSIAYNRTQDTRTLFFPVAVFSGQFFTAEYSDALLVKGVEFVQYGTELDSEPYKYHYDHDLFSNRYLFDGESKKEPKKNTVIAETSKDLGSKYMIDFVTKIGLSQYLSQLESQVGKINIDLWPLPEKKDEIPF